MDIMWCLCVEVNIQQRVLWFCEKDCLRTGYLILFECNIDYFCLPLDAEGLALRFMYLELRCSLKKYISCYESFLTAMHSL